MKSTYLEIFTHHNTKLGNALEGLEDRLNLDPVNNSYLFTDMSVDSSSKKNELKIVVDEFYFEEFRRYNSYYGYGVILKFDHDYPNEPSYRAFVDELIAKYGDERLEIIYHYLDMSNAYHESLSYSNLDDLKYSFENGDPIVSFYELRENNFNEDNVFYQLCCELEVFDWLDEIVNEIDSDEENQIKETISKKSIDKQN